jgi:hypothetical protein
LRLKDKVFVLGTVLYSISCRCPSGDSIKEGPLLCQACSSAAMGNFKFNLEHAWLTQVVRISMYRCEQVEVPCKPMHIRRAFKESDASFLVIPKSSKGELHTTQDNDAITGM